MIRISPEALANDVRLRRSQHAGAFLIVEGKDDRLLCERFIDRADCRVVVAASKSSVIEAVRILDAAGFRGLLGLIDADFDEIDGRELSSPNLIRTDVHDLDCFLVRSAALDGLLVEFGSAEKLARFGREVRPALLEAAASLGCLRLYSDRFGLGLRFDGIGYGAFVNPDTLQVDEELLVREVRNQSQRHNMPNAELLNGIGGIREEGHDPWSLCCGADLIGVLSIGLRRGLGTNDARVVSEEQLRRALRLAIDRSDFDASHVSNRMRAWQLLNPAFRVFRPE